MNGPDHYVKAEELLDEAADMAEWEPGEDRDITALVMAAYTAAQVHATLALAAAMAHSTHDWPPHFTYGGRPREDD